MTITKYARIMGRTYSPSTRFNAHHYQTRGAPAYGAMRTQQTYLQLARRCSTSNIFLRPLKSKSLSEGRRATLHQRDREARTLD